MEVSPTRENRNSMTFKCLEGVAVSSSNNILFVIVSSPVHSASKAVAWNNCNSAKGEGHYKHNTFDW